MTVADVQAFVDEAGHRGYSRKLTEQTDANISVMCALVLPTIHVDKVRADLDPLYQAFKRAAPAGARMHITDAFNPANAAWGRVAQVVREDLFEYMRQAELPVVFTVRRFGVERETFEATQRFVQSAREMRRSTIRIAGANMAPDDLVEDDLVIELALMLDEFAHEKGMQTVDLFFDQIDASVAKRYQGHLDATANISHTKRAARGFDPVDKTHHEGTVETRWTLMGDSPEGFRIDSEHLGQIHVVGKDDPLVFAVDVVANSLWRYLTTLPATSNLCNEDALAQWPLTSVVWGKGDRLSERI